ncbi:hypothetical protein BOSE21B_100310 [Bosea sp. 21B]|nr:hypothetical protein BOSE21B_100310 [Bosea sp. 21B]
MSASRLRSGRPVLSQREARASNWSRWSAEVIARQAPVVLIVAVAWQASDRPPKSDGAGGEDRTPDLRFTKPLHYRCATPALALRYQAGEARARAAGAGRLSHGLRCLRGGDVRCGFSGMGIRRDLRSVISLNVPACVAGSGKSATPDRFGRM